MYTLTIGIWRGTVTSRDVEEPKRFKTMEEVNEAVRKAREYYRRIGYSIWFTDVQEDQEES